MARYLNQPLRFYIEGKKLPRFLYRLCTVHTFPHPAVYFRRNVENNTIVALDFGAQKPERIPNKESRPVGKEVNAGGR